MKKTVPEVVGDNLLLIQSGGLDSTFLQYAYKDQIKEVIHFNYGQASFEVTEPFIREISRELGHKVKIYKFPIISKKDSLIFESREPFIWYKKLTDVENIGLVPNRHFLFLSYASAYAFSNSYPKVLVGVQQEPAQLKRFQKNRYNVWGDATSVFIEDFNDLLRRSLYGLVSLEMPIKEFPKKRILKLAKEIGVPVSRVHSCECYPACGYCQQCLTREKLGY